MMTSSSPSNFQLLLVSLVFICTILSGECSDFFRNMHGSSPRGGSHVEYYQTIGVETTGSVEQIKQAYRRKAMQTHPDKGGDTDDFKKLNEAYETLSDPDKRAYYDRFGVSSPQAGGVGGMAGENYNDMSGAFADIFRQFESGFGSRFFARPVVAEIEVTLEDMYRGKTITLAAAGNRNIDINILPGMLDGQQITVQGEITDHRGVPRDLIIQVSQARHHVFIRKNADLLIELHITLREALLGFEKPVMHLDGQLVWIRTKRGQVTGGEDVLVLEDLGMPILGKKDRGKLFVRIKLQFPRKMWLNEGEIELLETLLPPEEEEKEGKKNVHKDKGERVVVPSLARGLEEFGDSGDEPQNPFAGGFSFFR